MTYDCNQYIYFMYFANPGAMHATVYDNDGRVVEGHTYYVRRLSTPSFAEKKSSIDCYRTQWRWYFRDDTQKWVSYSKVRNTMSKNDQICDMVTIRLPVSVVLKRKLIRYEILANYNRNINEKGKEHFKILMVTLAENLSLPPPLSCFVGFVLLNKLSLQSGRNTQFRPCIILINFSCFRNTTAAIVSNNKKPPIFTI